jgi:hypothetical protein
LDGSVWTQLLQTQKESVVELAEDTAESMHVPMQSMYGSSLMESFLQEADAIMESGAFQVAKTYIMEAGGQPAKAISMLTDGYVGECPAAAGLPIMQQHVQHAGCMHR